MNKFKSKLHLACGKDFLRPVLQHIYFHKGKAICTDAHILIVQDLSLSGFSKEDIKKLEGKYLHRLTFAEIFKHIITSIDNDGINCLGHGTKIKFMFAEPFDKFPNYEAVIPLETKPVSIIGINPNILHRLSQAMMFETVPHFEYRFCGETKGIKVIAKGMDEKQQLGLIMPVLLNL